MSNAHGDLWVSIESWVEAKRKEGATAVDVADILGLNLLAAQGQDEEIRWALTAMAAAQIRSLTEPRKQLQDVNTPLRAIELLQSSKRIMVICGSGISPHVPGFEAFFESQAGGGLPEPESLFDPGRFVDKPMPLLSYVRTLLPGSHSPTLAHRFVKELEARGKLLHAYSQNLDGLEEAAGVQRVVACHGSLSTATCVACRHRVPFDSLSDEVAEGRIPRCRKCPHALNVLKPDVALLGEQPASVETEAALREDLPAVDLFLVLGSSLAVDPLRHVPASLARSIPQILISPAAPAFKHEWDVQLLGECDIVLSHICRALGWGAPLDGHSAPSCNTEPSKEGTDPSIYRFGAAAPSPAGKKAGAGLPPAQTPLATVPQPGQRGQKRWGLSLSGATIAGSGCGARSALAHIAPIDGTAPELNASAASGGKRPVPAGEAATAANKRAG